MFLHYIFFVTALFAIFPDCQSEKRSADPLGPFLGKTYKLVSSDANFDEILKALGLNWIKRKIYESAKPDLILTFNPSTKKYTLLLKTLLLHQAVEFELGQQFQTVTHDGRHIGDLFTQHDNTLTEVQSQPGKPDVVVERQFFPDKINEKVTLGKIVSYRAYDLVKKSSSA